MGDGKNPLLDEAGTHYAVPRVAYTPDGQLAQLWQPCDHSTHAPEWRAVEQLAPGVAVVGAVEPVAAPVVEVPPA